jgi:hypothetical protein
MKGFIAFASRRGFNKFLPGYFGLCSLLAPGVHAAALQWQANTDNTIGYKVYYQDHESSYPKVVNVGNATNFELPPLAPGMTYTLKVTAYNDAGLESDPSASISYTASGLHAGEDSLTRLSGSSLAVMSSLLLRNDQASAGGPLGIAQVIPSGNPKSAVVQIGNIVQYLPKSDMTNADWFDYIVTNSAYSARGRVNINVASPPPSGGSGTTGGVRPAAPRLALIPTVDGAQIRFSEATAGRDYRVQATTMMKEQPQWEDIGIVTAGPDGMATFNDGSDYSSFSAKFFRAVARD